MAFKLKFNRCSDRDFRAIQVLCLASDKNPIPKSWQKKRPRIFGALLGVLNHPDFEKYSLTKWTFGTSLPHGYLPQSDKIEAVRLLVKMFPGLPDKETLIQASWHDLIYQMASHPRFAKAFKRIYPTRIYDQVVENLALLTNKTIRTIEGRIEGYAGQIVRGFAVDINRLDASLDLDFKINGHFAGTARADYYRTDLEEKFGGHGRYAFEHCVMLPNGLHRAQDLTLEITDVNTGTLVCPPHVIGVDRADFTGTLMHLVQNLERLNDALLQQPDKTELVHDLKDRLKVLTNRLPKLEQFAAFPIDDYDVMRTLYKPGRQHLTPSSQPICFEILIVGDTPELVDVTKRSLADQSYQNWTTESVKPSGWVICLQAGDQLATDGLALLAQAALTHKNARCLFSDYDFVSSKNFDHHYKPHFLGPFDYDLLLCHYPFSRAAAFKKTDADSPVSSEDIKSDMGRLQHCLNLVTEHSEDCFHHVPHTLFHLYENQGDRQRASDLAQLMEEQKTQNRHQSLIEKHIKDRDMSASVMHPHDRFASSPKASVKTVWHTKNTTKLAVIIPTRDGLDMLKACVSSLLDTATDPENIEIIIVDNQSRDPQTLDWLNTFKNQKNHRVIKYDAPFNWSAMNNLAASKTDAEHYLFLNNDTRALETGWDQILKGYLSRDDIGVVGARLIFEDGTLQHAGVVLYDVGVAAHEAVGDSCDHGLYLERTKMPHRVSAVTGALLGCRADVFKAVQGFDGENLMVTFNDTDFCLKVGKTGKKVLYTPLITFQHLESKSRGYDGLNTEKQKRAALESIYMTKKWQHLLVSDPWYPSAFTRRGKAFSLLRLPARQINQ